MGSAENLGGRLEPHRAKLQVAVAALVAFALATTVTSVAERAAKSSHPPATPTVPLTEGSSSTSSRQTAATINNTTGPTEGTMSGADGVRVRLLPATDHCYTGYPGWMPWTRQTTGSMFVFGWGQNQPNRLQAIRVLVNGKRVLTDPDIDPFRTYQLTVPSGGQVLVLPDPGTTGSPSTITAPSSESSGAAGDASGTLRSSAVPTDPAASNPYVHCP